MGMSKQLTKEEAKAYWYPDDEFCARLDRTVELYHRLSESGACSVRQERLVSLSNPQDRVHIYVSGALHKEGGTVDQCTLSTADKRYLMEHGIPEEVILIDTENECYKGGEGVLNSADECYVASRIFHNGSNINGTLHKYRELHSVCSPIQVPRKWFYYMEFGLVPLIYSISFADSDVMDIVTEQLRGTENVIYNDHNAQSHDSEVWINSRKERMGKYSYK